MVLDIHHYGICMPPPSIMNFFLILGFSVDLPRITRIVKNNCPECRWMGERQEPQRREKIDITPVSYYEADCAVFHGAEWRRRLGPRAPKIEEYDVFRSPVAISKAFDEDPGSIVRIWQNGEPRCNLRRASKVKPTHQLMELEAASQISATQISTSDTELRGRALFGYGALGSKIKENPFYAPNASTALVG
eukprot:GSA25T00027682001.1